MGAASPRGVPCSPHLPPDLSTLFGIPSLTPARRENVSCQRNSSNRDRCCQRCENGPSQLYRKAHCSHQTLPRRYQRGVCALCPSTAELPPLAASCELLCPWRSLAGMEGFKHQHKIVPWAFHHLGPGPHHPQQLWLDLHSPVGSGLLPSSAGLHGSAGNLSMCVGHSTVGLPRISRTTGSISATVLPRASTLPIPSGRGAVGAALPRQDRVNTSRQVPPEHPGGA